MSNQPKEFFSKNLPLKKSEKMSGARAPAYDYPWWGGGVWGHSGVAGRPLHGQGELVSAGGQGLAIRTRWTSALRE